MTTHYSILGQRSLEGCSPWGRRVRHELATCHCSVTKLCPTLCNPMDCSPPGSSIQGILRQEYWSGLPFPSPGDLPDPAIELGSPALQADALLSEPPGTWVQILMLPRVGCRLSHTAQLLWTPVPSPAPGNNMPSCERALNSGSQTLLHI